MSPPIVAPCEVPHRGMMVVVPVETATPWVGGCGVYRHPHHGATHRGGILVFRREGAQRGNIREQFPNIVPSRGNTPREH